MKIDEFFCIVCGFVPWIAGIIVMYMIIRTAGNIPPIW